MSSATRLVGEQVVAGPVPAVVVVRWASRSAGRRSRVSSSTLIIDQTLVLPEYSPRLVQPSCRRRSRRPAGRCGTSTSQSPVRASIPLIHVRAAPPCVIAPVGDDVRRDDDVVRHDDRRRGDPHQIPPRVGRLSADGARDAHHQIDPTVRSPKFANRLGRSRRRARSGRPRASRKRSRVVGRRSSRRHRASCRSGHHDRNARRVGLTGS